jgi:hypothetical protein
MEKSAVYPPLVEGQPKESMDDSRDYYHAFNQRTAQEATFPMPMYSDQPLPPPPPPQPLYASLPDDHHHMYRTAEPQQPQDVSFSYYDDYPPITYNTAPAYPTHAVAPPMYVPEKMPPDAEQRYGVDEKQRDPFNKDVRRTQWGQIYCLICCCCCFLFLLLSVVLVVVLFWSSRLNVEYVEVVHMNALYNPTPDTVAWNGTLTIKLYNANFLGGEVESVQVKGYGYMDTGRAIVQGTLTTPTGVPSNTNTTLSVPVQFTYSNGGDGLQLRDMVTRCGVAGVDISNGNRKEIGISLKMGLATRVLGVLKLASSVKKDVKMNCPFAPGVRNPVLDKVIEQVNGLPATGTATITVSPVSPVTTAKAVEPTPTAVAAPVVPPVAVPPVAPIAVPAVQPPPPLPPAVQPTTPPVTPPVAALQAAPVRRL